MAKDVLEELIETGGVKHELPPKAWLGIYNREITEDLARQLRLLDTKGVLVLDVISGSPAEAAGLKPWDVIRRIDDRDIFTTADVAEAIAELQPGDEILVTVSRGGVADLFTVTLGDMPAELRTE